jgi:hypothetical protein
MRADQTGIENKTFKKEQMWEAFRDPKTWLMFMFNIFISIPNGGLTSMFDSVNPLTNFWGLLADLEPKISARSSSKEWAGHHRRLFF